MSSLLDEVDFLVLRDFLRAKADDFFFRLVDALLQLRFLTGTGRPAQIEELVFRRQHLRNIRYIGLLHKLIGKRDGRRAITLGREARLAGVELGQGLCNDREIGPRHGVIEPHQKIAGLDPIAVLDKQFSDHAAGRVLDLLDVRIRRQLYRAQSARRIFRLLPAQTPTPQRQEQDNEQCRRSYSAG